MRNLRTLLCVALLGASSLVSAFAADDAKKSYDIPAGDAATALKQFSATSGRETLFAAEVVRGVRTPAVKGELSAQQALDALLAGTGLSATADAKTGAIAVRRDLVVEKNAASRPAEAVTASSPGVRYQDGILTLDDYTVTGSRLRANSGEQPVQPVMTYTSVDIERTGAANLGQLFQYIPAITSFQTGISTETIDGSFFSGSLFGQVSSRTSAQLRGGSENATLLLVDGKRVPLTGLRNAGGNGYDLGGIPLSAIDRVEVLLDGASAIYGADAINGVINVILKKRYSGTELRFNYDNTFDKDAGFRTVSVTHGFQQGKLSGLVTASYADNNIMLLTDRRLSATYDRRTFGGSVNNAFNVAPTLSYGQGTGAVSVATGNLPGLTTGIAALPAGATGTGTTVAQFAAAGAPVPGIEPDRQSAVSYSREKTAYIRLAYEMNEHLTLTGMVRMSRKRMNDNGTYRRLDNVTIPANYPGNPFGVPIRLSKVFYDLPVVYTATIVRNDEFSLTASGKLAGSWRYEAAINHVEGENFMNPTRLPGAGNQVAQAVTSGTVFTTRLNAAIAAGRQPLFLYDSRALSPNTAAAQMDEFWVSTSPTLQNDRVQTWSYSAQADGKVWTLPAGDIQAAVGFERREEYVDFPGALGGTVWPIIPQRDVNAVFVEARIPVFAAKQDLPLMNQLDVNLAGRSEKYSDFGRADTPRYGVAWRPFKSVMLRGSYGEGFMAPPLYRTAQQTVTLNVASTSSLFTGVVDLSRGGTALTGTIAVLSGGNPNLKPQLSENWTYGAVIDVPKVKGLSVSFDYYDNKYSNAFGSIGNLLDRQTLAPETITRGPKLPTDPADWLGPIIGYDTRIINISRSRNSGYSFGVRYNRATEWGTFTFSSSGDKTLRREQKTLPNAALTPTINKRYVPLRVTSSLFWSRQAWEAGLTHVYGGEYWTDSSNQTLSVSRYTKAATRWDLSAGYDLGRRPGFGGADMSLWRRILRDTKIRLTVINVLNDEPPLDARGLASALVIDARLSRYVIDLTKRF